jgi:hypothetical protein
MKWETKANKIRKHGGSGPETMLSPPAWFLPGPERMRGGAARHFASAWIFHRGSHLEATLENCKIKIVILQMLGSINLNLKVDS